MTLRIIPLEERIVLDAALAGDAAVAVEAVEGDADSGDATLEAPADALVALQEVSAEDAYDTLPVEQGTLHLLVVSTHVQDYLQLGDAARDGVEVIYYDHTEATLQSILDSITETLQGRQANTIAFANEGTHGEMILTDDVTVSLQSLTQNDSLLGFWRALGDFVHEDGRIDLLACRVAAITDGQTLVTMIEGATGRDVAASTDDTANSDNGGDWILETDNIDAQGLYFNPEAIAGWDGILLHGNAPECDPTLIDINQGGQGGDPPSFPSYLTELNGELYFFADDGNTQGAGNIGNELWKINSNMELELVRDINDGTGNSRVGSNSGSAVPTETTDPSKEGTIEDRMIALNGKLYFSADNGATNGNELHEYDPVTDTLTVIDIEVGAGDSDPQELTAVGNVLFFSANTQDKGRELYVYNPGASTLTLLQINLTGTGEKNDSNPTYLTELGGKLYFQAEDGSNGTELWESDGKVVGTVMRSDINTTGNGDSDPKVLTPFKGDLYFSAKDGGNNFELYRFDPGTNSVAQVTVAGGDINTSASADPDWLTVVNGQLFFAATDTSGDTELWVYNGTGDPSKIDINSSDSSNPSSLFNFNGTLIFAATDGMTGVELWKSDGTTGGTEQILDIRSGGSSNPEGFTIFDGLLYFRARDSHGNELWRTDGTMAGTELCANIRGGAASGQPNELTVVGNKLYFEATDSGGGPGPDNHGFELYFITGNGNGGPGNGNGNGSGELPETTDPGDPTPPPFPETVDTRLQLLGLLNPGIEELPEYPDHLSMLPRFMVDENTPPGTFMGSLRVFLPSSWSGTKFTLLSDDLHDPGKFTLDPDSGDIDVAGSLDFEAKQQYAQRVRIDRPGADSVITTVIIDINDVNEPPTDVVLDNYSVDEHSADGTLIGTLIAEGDPDRDDSHTFVLIDNDGGRFEIVGNELHVANGALIDFEEDTAHAVIVRAVDEGGLHVEKVLTIEVNDIDETTLEATEDKGPIGLEMAVEALHIATSYHPHFEAA